MLEIRGSVKTYDCTKLVYYIQNWNIKEKETKNVLKFH